MADILRIKRRAAGGAAGPPATLAASELAFNEQDNTLYYGKGNNAGQATSIVAIATVGGGGGGGTSITIADTPPGSPTAGALWWESDTGTLWLYYNDGTSTQWVQVNSAGGISQASIDTSIANAIAAKSVRYDTAQPALTTAQELQARQNVYAAPLDALAFNGLQINGGMEIWQEFPTGFSGALNNTRIADLWNISTNTATPGTWNVARSTLLPITPYGGYLQCATPPSAPTGAAEYILIQYGIEGIRTAKLFWGSTAAKPITICFTLMSAKTGTATVAIRNATNRSYVTTISIVANTWTHYTITVPGDTTGTWNTDTNASIWISIAFGVGATYSTATLNTWLAGNFFGGTGQTTGFFTAANDIVYIANFFVMPGNEAPTSYDQATIAMRDRVTEIELVQRYYQKSFKIETGPANGQSRQGPMIGIGLQGNLVQSPLIFFKNGDMRITPTMKFFNATGVGSPAAGQWSWYAGGVWTGGTGTTLGVSDPTSFCVYMQATGITQNGAYFVDGNWTADARF